MAKIIIFTDFDGTITRREGLKTVLDDFYQSLMMDYIAGKRQNYRDATLLSSEHVQQMFEEKFGKYSSNFNYGQKDADILMSADAISFFKQAVNNPEVTVKIITKNREDYIHEVLKYHGFSQEELSKIIIDDTGHKNAAVIESLSAAKLSQSKPSHIYVLDDNPYDFEEMVKATKSPIYGYQEEQIKKYNQQPGQFQWAQYQQEMQALFPTPVEELLIEVPAVTGTQDTSTNKKADTVVDKNRQNHSPENNAQQRVAENISPVISLAQQNTERTFKITGFSFAAGFFLGLLVSAILIATGVLAPLGFGIMGISTLTMATASGLGLVSGAIAFVTAKCSEEKIPSQDDELPSLKDNTQPLHGLGGPVDKASNNDVPVEHFPSVLTQQNAENNPSAQQEQEHYERPNVSPK